MSHFKDYIELLDALIEGYRACISGMTVEGLDWVPGKDMNSLSVLVCHVTGSGRFWIGDIANDDPSNRDRKAEFCVKGLTEADLAMKLDTFMAYATNSLSNIDLIRLSRLIPVERENGTEHVSGMRAILHALEHTALHLGHAQLTRQLWDQR